MSTPVAKSSRRPALFLYGTLLYPLAWIVHFLLSSAHRLKMHDLPLTETILALSILIGFGCALLALLRKENSLGLVLVVTALYSYWLFCSVA